MNKIKCKVCNSLNNAVKYNFKFIVLRKCKNCKTIFAVSRVYEGTLLEDDWETDIKNIPNYYDEQFKVKNKIYLDELAAQGLNKGKLLDIGCAYGDFLDAARRKGWSIHGIEFSKTACEIAKSKYNIIPINSLYHEKYFKRNFFDIVVMFDVLEHIDTPIEMIDMIKLNLKSQNGYLMMTCPNINSITAKLCVWSYYLSFGIVSKPVKMLAQVFYNSHHIIYFNKRNLKIFLKRQVLNLYLLKPYLQYIERPFFIERTL